MRKKSILFLGAILLLGVVLTGFNTNMGQQHAAKVDGDVLESAKPDHGIGSQDSSDTEIQNGTNEVITKIKELKELTEKQVNNRDEINQLGKEIEESWDEIEKKVEKAYPEDYQNIEESLYPLITMAKQEKLNKTKIRTLSLETLDKLEQFNQKL
ncbi:hypothetical protein [Lentibacillus salinarum]|uniref:Uncharacterized protein n=1 Tax=Lentibacillus salinarum TaxID=446820 RepID=A0ABW3ZS15_9BACI